jgi:hypothetical protein
MRLSPLGVVSLALSSTLPVKILKVYWENVGLERVAV